MSLCIDLEKSQFSYHSPIAVRLVLEVRDWLSRGEAICARKQKAYRRSVKQGYARGDPEIEAESGKDFEVEEWRAC